MLEHMARHWWTLALRGALAVLFALIAFAHPFGAAFALVTLFGAFVLADGVFALIAAARLSHQDERWLPLIVEGVVGVLFGIITFASPAAVAAALVFVAAAWAILTGILEVAAAVRLRRVIAGEFWLILVGALSIVFGVALLADPLGAVAALTYILGAYALLFGILLIALSLRLRRLTGV
ncbi:MAG: DUF308 domain-containing protein [Armatimonadetes bacterium]|nr:DUF308 domain-containing protein [Armatimonadota bacterium]